MTDTFKEFEHQRWQSAVDQYDASFGKLTEQTVPRMLDVLAVKPGTRFLDVACGPGFLTSEAARLGAQVLGVDFSAAMIDRARQNHPGLAFQIGDAEMLEDLASGSFDAAGMNFGILHLSNPEQAVRELHRVLGPGGRAAFTVWRKPDEAVGFAIVLRAIEQHGNPNLLLPEGPPFFFYSEPRQSERLLTACGFSHRIETLKLTWKLSGPDELFEAFYHGTARTGGLLRRQSPDDLARIRAAVRQAAQAYVHDGVVVIPMPAQLSWGVK